MQKAGAEAVLARRGEVHQTVEHVVTHESAGAHRDFRRQFRRVQRRHDGAHRQRREIGNRAAQDDGIVNRFRAVVIGDFCVPHVDRHALDAQRGAVSRLPDAQHDVRFRAHDRDLQRNQRARVGRRQLGGHDIHRTDARGQPPHRLDGGVELVAAERLEPGDQDFHGREVEGYMGKWRSSIPLGVRDRE